MNDDTGGRDRRRPGLRRPGVLAAALAGIALLAAACGGGASPAAAGLTAYQKSVAYAQCMRAHGEPGYPDPTSNGGFIIDGKKDHLNGSLMQSANKTCQHLLPKSAPLTAAQQRQLTSQALKFVACMRSHGLPAFPDPVVNANGVEFREPAGIGPNSIQFQSAQQACHKLLPGGLP
jgi:hypothetical protein